MQRLRQLAIVAAWAGMVVLALVVLARLVAFDDVRVLLLINTVTYWIFLPAYVILAVAIACRRYGLASLAAALVVFHVVVVSSSLTPAAAIPRAALTAPRIRIFSANLYVQNPHTQGIVREISASRADVVLLQELSGRWERSMRDSTLWDEYPYHAIVRPGRPLTGVGVLSRLPLTDVATHVVAGMPMIEVTVDAGGRSVRVFDLHPNAPVADFQRWSIQSDAITREVARAPGRLVAAGDFNVTQFNEWMDELEDLGLRSAHEALGRGTATTYPNGKVLELPPVRLDHVMVSSGVVPLRIREGDGEGSDHKPVIVDLAITRRR